MLPTRAPRRGWEWGSWGMRRGAELALKVQAAAAAEGEGIASEAWTPRRQRAEKARQGKGRRLSRQPDNNLYFLTLIKRRGAITVIDPDSPTVSEWAGHADDGHTCHTTGLPRGYVWGVGSRKDGALP